MRIKKLTFSALFIAATALFGGETQSPNWNDLKGWFLHSGKITEVDGIKFLHLETDDNKNPARINHYFNAEGIKKINISVTYRTAIENSTANRGAWYYIGFKGLKEMEAMPLPKSTEWKTEQKTITLPAGAKEIITELRVQGVPKQSLEVREINIELID